MSSALPNRSSMAIGEVLALLRPDFPDVTISKIRFLESEGLVEPERTPSGYRKFTASDVDRLRYVLAAQRDRYLPLRVIREQLDAVDRGDPVPGGPDAYPATSAERALAAASQPGSLPGPDSFADAFAAVPGPSGPPAGGPDGAGEDGDGVGPRHDRAGLLAATGLGAAELDALEEAGLVTPGAEGGYDDDARVVAATVALLGTFGIEPRHLRGFRAAADREVGLMEQVLAPLAAGHGGADGRTADETGRELAALFVRLRTALLKARLGASYRPR